MNLAIHTKRKISMFAFMVALILVCCVAVFGERYGVQVASVQATSTATTTVTVLNTPPDWVVFAYEQTPSSTTTPTNSESAVTWTATAFDNNGETYYLLICKSSSTPTFPGPLPSNTVPQCGGGTTDQWAVSAPTPSNTAAVVSTTTQEAWVTASESFDWFGYICDSNIGVPRCNAGMYNGLHEPSPNSATSSPFVINRRPLLTLAADTSVAPGEIATWTTTASDPDSLGGQDTIQLHVCRTVGFNPLVPSCTGVQWATSSYTTINPSATTTIPIPTQDGDLDAFVYLIDEHGHVASGAWQGSSTVLTVDNVAPYIASTTIQFYGVFGSTTSNTNLVLSVPEGETQNFVVAFEASDNNGCLNTGLTNEIINADINVFRSGIGGTYGLGCDSVGEYNARYCYTHTSPNWNPICYQVSSASCTANDVSVDWECTFPLWHIADPTDGGSVFAGEDWRASVRVTDEALTGEYSTEDHVADTGAQMTQFLSFRATGTPIAYGSFEPGFGNATHIATTTVFATGNTGLDQYLSGDAMCVTYPNCTGNATSTIYVSYQHYATTSSSVAYGAGFLLSTSTTPTYVNVSIAKPTSTSTPTSDDTYWGIFVPGTITFAGDYIGRNYIDAVVAPSTEW
jgi:hypothetical protein